MWIAILFMALAATIASIFYLIGRFKKFYFVRRLARGSKKRLKLFGFLCLLPLIVYGVFDLVNAIILMLHLSVFWLIFEAFASLHRKLKKRRRARLKIDLPYEVGADTEAEVDSAVSTEAVVRGESEDGDTAADAVSRDDDKKQNESEDDGKKYWLGAAVLIFTTVYLAIGWYNAHHVAITKYKVNTEKNIGKDTIRIVQITDSHVGTTFDGEGFAEHMKTVQDLHPDIVVITGDYVDDSTTKEDMVRSCEALGELETTYGIYYVYGNHDRGYYSSRDFSADDMEAELMKNNVVVLQDESVLVDDSIYVVGRKDASAERGRGPDKGGRLSAQKLTEELDKSKFILMLDHQPTDYDNEAASGADLVLSGHSHGGQLIPLQFIGQYIIRANNRTYGIEKRKDTTFIVCSGISDWAIDFKTGCISEIVVVDVQKKD